MKVGSKDAADSAASFALLFVKNYAILELSDKISAGGWWIPKFLPLSNRTKLLYSTVTVINLTAVYRYTGTRSFTFTYRYIRYIHIHVVFLKK